MGDRGGVGLEYSKGVGKKVVLLKCRTSEFWGDVVNRTELRRR